MRDVDDNITLIKRNYDAIWSGDEAAFCRQVGGGFVEHAMPPDTPKGVEQSSPGARRSAQPFLT
jgi:hypothetical protein